LKDLFLVGAEQKSKVMNDWEQFRKAVVLRMDGATKEIKRVIEYISPQEVCPEHEASISFTAGTLRENKLYVGTQTEILIYNVITKTLIDYVSLPLFNDVHHVTSRKNGNLLVANTGLDMVVELDLKGNVINLWNVMGGGPWSRFDPDTDYRKITTTKPHMSHPNFVFELNGEVWVTRCLQKDAICLTDRQKRIDIGRQLIHDGVVYNGKIYFTQVDGRIVIVNASTLKVEREVNLVEISRHNEKIGWCRGIKPLSEELILIGFSRIRPSSKKRADGSTYYVGDYGVMPTRLACYNIKSNTLLWEKNLEEQNMNVIYSIH
jgi:outer membrane protein assembly factor BamB